MYVHKSTIVNLDRVISEEKNIRSEEESRKIRKKLSKINSGAGNPNAKKLTAEDAKEIIKMKEQGIRGVDIADKFGISQIHVSRIGRDRWLSVV